MLIMIQFQYYFTSITNGLQKFLVEFSLSSLRSSISGITEAAVYIYLVQPYSEYACQVWDLHLSKDRNAIEEVQKFVVN